MGNQAQVFSLISLCVIVLCFCIWHLRTLHGHAIRLIWLFFGIGCHVSFLILVFAREIGAIDSNGSFNGPLGHVLDVCMKLFMDINGDFLLALGIVSMLIVPQLIAYVLSGLSRNAGPVLFVGPAIDFLVWFVVKSFITIAGLLSVVLGAAIWYHWLGPRNTEFVLTCLSVIVLTTTCAFVVIVIRLLGGELLELITASCPRVIVRWARRIHWYASGGASSPVRRQSMENQTLMQKLDSERS